MRIISGSAKGMNLKSPHGKKIRPTSEKVKEAFFNIVQDRIKGSWFLDLFSGSGGIGLEALSRGAEKCIFVDKDRNSIQLIRENIQLTGMQEKARVCQGDAGRALLGFSKEEICFDIVYIDPPYKYTKITDILFLLHHGRLLVGGGIIGVERPSRNGTWDYSPFSLQQKKNYGDTELYLLVSRE